MKYKLSDIAEFNPRESIKKGSVAKKVAMDKLQPFCRDIPEYEYVEFTGGTKFRNGDTIMARITPCLENGKTAKVRLNGKQTLDDLCDVIAFAFSFINDHSYEYSLDGNTLSTEEMIDSFHLHRGQEIELHYDFGDDWIFRISVEKIYKTPDDRPWAIVSGDGFVLQYPPIDGDDEEVEAAGEIESVDSAE